MACVPIVIGQAGSTDGITATAGPFDTTGANLLVVAVTNYTSTTAAVTDSKGNTWTPRTQYGAGGQFVRLFECVGTPTVGTGHTFSASAGGATIYPRIAVVAASGAAASPFQAEQGNASTGLTSIASGAGPLTPTSDGALIVLGLNNGAGEAATIDGGFTAVTGAYDASHAIGGGVAYRAQTTAAGVNPSFSWTTSAAAAVAMAIYLPAVGGGGANATGYSLAASPSSVPTGTPVTITANLLGGTVLATTLDITLADSLGSTISGHILIPNGPTSGTATITPTAVGTHNITATHTGGGFTGGDGPTTFTAITATTVPVTNVNLYFSPGNWCGNGGGTFGSNNVKAGSAYVITSNPGAYLRIRMVSTGSGSVTLNLDTTVLQGISAGSCPILGWFIDGTTPYTTSQLAYSASPVALSLATGLAAGTHDIFVFFRAVDLSSALAMGDRWNNPTTGFSGVKVTGVTLDSGSTIAAPPVRARRAIWFGDSSLECAQIVNGNLTPDGQDAAGSYGLLSAPGFDAEVGIVGFSTQGYSQAGYGNVPALYNATLSLAAWSNYYAGSSRLGQPLDYLICSHGINGSATSGLVQAWLNQVRAALPPVKILVAVPWTSTNRDNIIAGFQTYQSATPDVNCFLINGGTNFSSFNNGFAYHPSYEGAALAAASYVGAIRASGAVAGGGAPAVPAATAYALDFGTAAPVAGERYRVTARLPIGTTLAADVVVTLAGTNLEYSATQGGTLATPGTLTIDHTTGTGTAYWAATAAGTVSPSATNGSGLTDPTIAAMTATAAPTGGGGGATLAELQAALASFNNTGQVDPLPANVVQFNGNPVVLGDGTATAVGASSITIPATTDLKDYTIQIVSAATGSHQARMIASSDIATGVQTLSAPWSPVPTGAVVYQLDPPTSANVVQFQGVPVKNGDGTAIAVGASSITIPDTTNLAGWTIRIIRATTGAPQARTIVTSNTGTGLQTLDSPWTPTPTGTIDYELIEPPPPVTLTPAYDAAKTAAQVGQIPAEFTSATFQAPGVLAAAALANAPAPPAAAPDLTIGTGTVVGVPTVNAISIHGTGLVAESGAYDGRRLYMNTGAHATVMTEPCVTHTVVGSGAGAVHTFTFLTPQKLVAVGDVVAVAGA